MNIFPCVNWLRAHYVINKLSCFVIDKCPQIMMSSCVTPLYCVFLLKKIVFSFVAVLIFMIDNGKLSSWVVRKYFLKKCVEYAWWSNDGKNYFTGLLQSLVMFWWQVDKLFGSQWWIKVLYFKVYQPLIICRVWLVLGGLRFAPLCLQTTLDQSLEFL